MAKELGPLFEPFKLGRFDISHKIVYAPLTRCRAIDSIPHPNAAIYYSQRATKGGFMLTEGTIVAEDGYGYPAIPGIHKREQIEAWKPIVDAVHAKGATFFMQIWHCGAISHPAFQPNGGPPPSASDVRPGGKVLVPGKGMVDLPVPRPIDAEDIPKYVNFYRQGARNALDAGFDGVEIHGANQYLIDQFLKSSSNKRTDKYGGSIENRVRFCLEVVQAVIDEVGADRVGLRLAPFVGAHKIYDEHTYALNVYLLEELNKLDIAYVHFVEPRDESFKDAGSPEAVFDHNHTKDNLDVFRKVYRGTFLVAGGYTKGSAIEALNRDHADAIVFGRWYLANPDLVHRFKVGAELNKYDRATFYTQDPVKGFIDYPFLEDSQANGSA